jgi:hypothetical protein
MAISRARAGALLVSRPATFAHATNSTASASVPSIATSIVSGGDCASLICSSVRATTSRLRFVSGYARWRSLPMSDSSTCALERLTPGLRRPFSVKLRLSRSSSGLFFGSPESRGHIISGT